MNQAIDDLLPALADKFIQDYASYSKRHGFTVDMGYSISFEAGRKFARIVRTDKSSRSTVGFIQLVDDKNFKAGTLLKAAGWKAPALNFARGSIFDLDNAKCISWTGIS